MLAILAFFLLDQYIIHNAVIGVYIRYTTYTTIKPLSSAYIIGNVLFIPTCTYRYM